MVKQLANQDSRTAMGLNTLYSARILSGHDLAGQDLAVPRIF